MARTATGSAASPFWDGVAIALGHPAFRKKIAAVGITTTTIPISWNLPFPVTQTAATHFVHPAKLRSSQETPEVLKLHPKPEGSRPEVKIMDSDQDRVSFLCNRFVAYF